ncbi:UTP--glucose-1-phosphate uridylyltransferase [Rhodococcus pyridinivorans]
MNDSPDFRVTFRTAVVPAAGLGTRFLPATKTVPKELLPVLDTPGIELVAGEAAQSGAQRLLIVTAPGKDRVVAHFAENLSLEEHLEAKGKTELLEKVRRAPNLLRVDSVVQDRPLGLGHAVSCAEAALGADEDALAVLLPDDIVKPHGILKAMARVRAERGGSVLCAIDVPKSQVSSYGILEVEEAPKSASLDVLRVLGVVEKPALSEAPSTLAAAGRYLLDRKIFHALRRIKPGVGGELQLTDAIALLIDEGHPVHVVVHRGTRHDLGNPGGYLRAAVDAALNSEEYGDGLGKWLRERLDLDSSDAN